MANWKQIQARIRKARVGADAIPKMTALFERTRDAMVAFELAQLYEKAAAVDDAVKWFYTAWQRFRRADWKKKTEEALSRLGAALPVASPQDEPEPATTSAEIAGEPAADAEEGSQKAEAAPAVASSGPQAETAREGQRKRTRRGRRGGRGRRKGRPAAPAIAAAPARTASEPPPHRPAARAIEVEEEAEPELTREEITRAGRSRAGDPGLASRVARLDSQLRRLLAATPYSLSESELAPAGPGVFLLSDSELTTHYYVERCDTLRIALKMVSQGSRGRNREESVRARLAGHLQINENNSKKYLQQHCAARWLQLDEGASHLAHYAIAVLRPVLND